jgi:hypothetical protein
MQGSRSCCCRSAIAPQDAHCSLSGGHCWCLQAALLRPAGPPEPAFRSHCARAVTERGSLQTEASITQGDNGASRQPRKPKDRLQQDCIFSVVRTDVRMRGVACI